MWYKMVNKGNQEEIMLRFEREGKEYAKYCIVLRDRVSETETNYVSE